MFRLADYERLLDDFQAAARRRAGAERQLAAHFGGEDIEAIGLEQKLTAAQSHRAAELGRVDAERDEVLSGLERWHQERIAELDARERSRVAEAVARFDAETVRLEEDVADKHWVVGSLLDENADESPQRRLDRLILAYDATEQTMRSAEEGLENELQAAASRQGYAYRTPEPAKLVNREPGELTDRHETAIERGHVSLARLRRMVIAKALRGPRIAILFAALAAIPATLGWVLIDPLDHGISRDDFPVYVFGGSAALAAVVSLVVGLICSSRRRRAWAAATGSMRKAITLRESWSRKIAPKRDKEIDRLQAEVESAEARRQTKQDQIAGRRVERQRELERERDDEIAAAGAERTAERERAVGEYDEAVREVEREHQRRRTDADNATRVAVIGATEALDDYRERRETEISELESRMTRGWTGALAKLSESVSAARIETAAADWSQLADPDWRPADQLPRGLRIGHLVCPLDAFPAAVSDREALRLPAAEIELPAVLPFPSMPSAVFRGRGADFRTEGTRALQVALLRAFTQIPPGKVRCTLIDPVGLGEAFAGFMHLADVDERLVSGRVWTESGQIESQLADLTEHMENVLQTYLRGDFETIEDYNRMAGEVAEPYRFLVIAGFPHRFTEVAWRRLKSIAQSGPRCGVFLLLTHDEAAAMPVNADAADLTERAELFTWDGERFRPGEEPRAEEPLALTAAAALMDDETEVKPLEPTPPPPTPPLRRLALVVDEPPPAEQFTRIVRNVADRSRDAGRVEVAFNRVAPVELWQESTKKGLDIPLGRAGATKLQHASFGRGTAQHMLVAGKTGSGKSTFLHALVTCAAMRYSPDEIRFFLIDFKKGVEFKAYAGAHDGPPLPHADVIAIESEREFGVSALRRLDEILDERGELFRNAGVQDVASYRNARPDAVMPRILLLIDEFQEFFVEDDKLAQEATLLLDRLVRQGRAFGVHCVLGSQTLGGAYGLPRTTLGQIGIRVALQCSEADAHTILSEGNTAARLLGRPGEAIYNDAGGLVEGNQPFQVAWLPDAQRADIIARLVRHGESVGRDDPRPVIFEGDRVALLQASGRIRRLLTGETQSGPLRVDLGDAVEIKPPIGLDLKRQSGRNLLVCGPAAELARGILTAAAVQARLQSEEAEIVVLHDPDESGADWQPLADAYRLTLASASDADRPLRRLDRLFAARVGEAARTEPPALLIVDGLAAFRDLAAGDDFGFGGGTGLGGPKLSNPLAAFGGGDVQPDPEPAKSTAAIFHALLADGPQRGLHTLVWADGATATDRILGRKGLREFAFRALTQLNGNDSSQLIDTPAASRLSGNAALLYHVDTGAIEKFRPYAVPPADLAAEVRIAEEVEDRMPAEEPAAPSLDDFLVV